MHFHVSGFTSAKCISVHLWINVSSNILNFFFFAFLFFNKIFDSFLAILFTWLLTLPSCILQIYSLVIFKRISNFCTFHCLNSFSHCGQTLQFLDPVSFSTESVWHDTASLVSHQSSLNEVNPNI